MDKTTAALLAAAASLASMGAAQAAAPPMPNPSEALQAASYADLLTPVENAVAVMKADDAARAQTVQYYTYGPPPGYHHHHHHHHAYYRRHHHHHHHASYVGIPGVGGVVIGH